MKPFTRIKLIKGIEYVYEITPYYDPELKKTRQKSRYMGKYVEGRPVRVEGTCRCMHMTMEIFCRFFQSSLNVASKMCFRTSRETEC